MVAKAHGKGNIAPQPAAKANGKVSLKAGAKAGKPGEETPGDADLPLLDMSDAQVRKMIQKAKARGYVTYDELNKVLPSDKVSSEQIEDTMSLLNEMGINVIESEEQEEGADENLPAVAEGGKEVVAVTGKAAEQYDRTDDPVRMYLREMGSVELLRREGEIAIAKRIEAGRELMIGALCEIPADVRGAHRVARRIERGQGPSARHHRPRSDVRRRPRGPAAAALRDANNPNAQAIAAANVRRPDGAAQAAAAGAPARAATAAAQARRNRRRGRRR